MIRGHRNWKGGATEAVIFVNGNVITLNPRKPRVEAIAVRDGTIIGVGNIEETLSVPGKSAKVIDLEGKTVLPRFADSTCI